MMASMPNTVGFPDTTPKDLSLGKSVFPVTSRIIDTFKLQAI